MHKNRRTWSLYPRRETRQTIALTLDILSEQHIESHEGWKQKLDTGKFYLKLNTVLAKESLPL